MAPRRARGQKTAAVERREASVPRRADGESLPARGRAGLRYWPAHKRVPMHPSAFRRSASLTLCEGNKQGSEVVMTRENDDACLPINRCFIGSFVIARSEATKQSSFLPHIWIASLRSQ